MEKALKLAFARVNYSADYGFYDSGNTYKERDILIPYQLLVLAGSTRTYGIDVRIFDGEVGLKTERQLTNEILEWEPDFVGFTATTPDIDRTMYACELIHEKNPLIIIIIGGSHATAMPNEVLKNQFVDYVVKGQGERAIIDIVYSKTNDRIIESDPLGYRLDPAFDMLDYSDYPFTDLTCGQVKAASVMTAYGCPYGCKFCFHDKNVIYRSAEDFINDIKYLYNVKQVKYFYIYDDTFLLNKARATYILGALESFNNAHFQCLTRANLIDEEITRRMVRANFVRVSMGLESGSDEILKHVSKGVSIADAINACRILHDAGIETRASFILGLPYETHDTINETIEFAKSLDLYHANFNIMTPYPGTEVYEMAKREEGLRFANKKYETDWSKYRRWGKAIVETAELSAEDLELYQVNAQVEFYSQDKIYEYYYNLFKNGNKSKYFYRPLNFAWQNKFNKDVPFWSELNGNGAGEQHELNGKRNQVCDRV